MYEMQTYEARSELLYSLETKFDILLSVWSLHPSVADALKPQDMASELQLSHKDQFMCF